MPVHRPRRIASLLAPLVAAGVALGLSACATPPRASRAQTAVAARAEATPLRVMTFNIRYDNPGDGPNAWPHRRDWVANLMRFHEADAIGLQEAEAHQLTELDARLPGFARVGVGRTDGRADGEFSPIVYRTDRLTLLESGTFWLSETPEVVGSKGWDTAIERIATWARFEDRRTGCRHLHLNTHFDHIGERARQESARLIRRRLATLGGSLPLVVTGDMNAVPSSVAYGILTREAIDGAAPPLVDAFHATRTPHYGPTATWTEFKAIEPGQRIDYVLVSSGIAVLTHGILPDYWDGRFPSDHLPVIASLGIACR